MVLDIEMNTSVLKKSVYCMLMWKNPKSEINVFSVSPYNRSTVVLMKKAPGPLRLSLSAAKYKEMRFYINANEVVMF